MVLKQKNKVININDFIEQRNKSTVQGVRMLMRKFSVILYKGESGYIVAECPALRGCVSQGKTREEAIKNIREAIDAYIESLEKDGIGMPFMEQLEVEVD